jgi:hypothetical protein
MDYDEPHLSLNEKTQPIQWTEWSTGALVHSGPHCLVRSSWWSLRNSCTEVVIMSIPRVSSNSDVRQSFIFLYQVWGYEKRILVFARKQKSIPICQNHLNNVVSF